MIRVETLGSYWEMDDDLLRYRRWPKQEAPRERAEWSDERAGRLQDFLWHPMFEWYVSDLSQRLRIRTSEIDADNKATWVTAPMDIDEYLRLDAMGKVGRSDP